jgi:hypothetical protein
MASKYDGSIPNHQTLNYNFSFRFEGVRREASEAYALCPPDCVGGLGQVKHSNSPRSNLFSLISIIKYYFWIIYIGIFIFECRSSHQKQPDKVDGSLNG